MCFPLSFSLISSVSICRKVLLKCLRYFQANTEFLNRAGGTTDSEKKKKTPTNLRRTAGFCISILCLLWRSTVETAYVYVAQLFCHSEWLHTVTVTSPVLLGLIILIITWSLTLNLHLLEQHLMFRVSVDIIV